MKKIGIIIFARLNSKRLPKKILKKINETSILEIIFKRAKLIKKINNIILAMPREDKNNKIER